MSIKENLLVLDFATALFSICSTPAVFFLSFIFEAKTNLKLNREEKHKLEIAKKNGSKLNLFEKIVMNRFLYKEPAKRMLIVL